MIRVLNNPMAGKIIKIISRMELDIFISSQKGKKERRSVNISDNRTRATGGTPTTSAILYSDSRSASNRKDMGNKSKKSIKQQHRQQQQKQNIAKLAGAQPRNSKDPTNRSDAITHEFSRILRNYLNEINT